MKFLNFARNEFTDIASDKLHQSKQVLDHLTGAWEVWVQIETALEFINHPEYKHYTFEREKRYPGGGFCDFVLDPDRSQGNLLWVELKVLLQSGPADLVRRYINDVDKMLDAKPHIKNSVYKNNTGGAIAFAPTDAKDVINQLITRDPYDHEKYYFQAWKDTEKPTRDFKQLSSSSGDRLKNTEALIIYRAVFNGA